jgi:gliding motility-associated-like protein
VGCFPVSKDILSNDTDPDGNKISLTLIPVLQPKHGTVTMNQKGVVTYIPIKYYYGKDSLKYEICDDGLPGYCDTATVHIVIFFDENCDGIPDTPQCEFFIPEGFSPNGDGIHDYFEVACIEKYPNGTMSIYNRWGNKLYEKNNYGNLSIWGTAANAWWDGYSDSSFTVGNKKVPAGNYIYIFNPGDGKLMRGTVMVSY